MMTTVNTVILKVTQIFKKGSESKFVTEEIEDLHIEIMKLKN